MEIRGQGIIRHQLKCLFVYVSQAKLRRKACVDFSIHKETLILSRQLKSPLTSLRKAAQKKGTRSGAWLCTAKSTPHITQWKQTQIRTREVPDWKLEAGGGMGKREKRQEGEREGAQPSVWVFLLKLQLEPNPELRKGNLAPPPKKTCPR